VSESHEPFRTPIAPYLYYEDAGAAMDWLVRVFGFEEIVRMPNPDGRVGHAELRARRRCRHARRARLGL
jgi:hypothetical protein